MDHSKNAVAVFNKHATVYQEKFMDVGLYAKALTVFCDSIEKQQSKILELACGPGNVTKYLLQKRPDFKILATDLSENMLALARINNPTAIFKALDAREILSLNEKYDGIVCSFLLPYLTNSETKKLIEDCAVMLHAGGLLYISTMQGNYEDSGIQTGSKGDKIYMHYYQEKDLIAFLKENRFKYINTFRKKSTMSNGKGVVDLIVIAQKQS